MLPYFDALTVTDWNHKELKKTEHLNYLSTSAND